MPPRRRGLRVPRDKREKQPIGRIISNNLFILKIAFKTSKIYTISRLKSEIWLRFVVFVEHTLLVGYLISAITDNVPIWQPICAIAAVFVLTMLGGIEGNVLGSGYYPKKQELLDRELRLMIFKKAEKMDLESYDNPEFFNDFVWAMEQATSSTNDVLDGISQLLGGVFALVLIGGYLASLDVSAIIFSIISFFGIFFVSTKINKLNYELRDEQKPLERKRDYVKRLFYLSDHASEMRLNNITERMLKDFEKTKDELVELNQKKSKKIFKVSLLYFVFGDFLYGFVFLLYLMYKAIELKAFSFGTMYIIYGAANQVRTSLNILSRAIPSLQENSLYIEKIRKFLDTEIKITSPNEPKPMPKENADIVLNNISFGYNEKTVLKNIDLTIKKGEKIAIVGQNGCGKSTLVKLLMRLYDVTNGSISYGGNDIREYDLKEYRNRFRTVFQDYQIFAATVRENITMSCECDDERLKDAIEKGGFAKKLEKLENGLDTQLTREFDKDGCLLSGGESQTLVTSRAFYGDSDIIILDEPSSALDPIAEYNLNRSVSEMSKDKTVITISHRLSTTVFADKIYLICDGEIAEAGSHEELMKLHGKYYEMFELQAQKYRI